MNSASGELRRCSNARQMTRVQAHVRNVGNPEVDDRCEYGQRRWPRGEDIEIRDCSGVVGDRSPVVPRTPQRGKVCTVGKKISLQGPFLTKSLQSFGSSYTEYSGTRYGKAGCSVSMDQLLISITGGLEVKWGRSGGDEAHMHSTFSPAVFVPALTRYEYESDSYWIRLTRFSYRWLRIIAW